MNALNDIYAYLKADTTLKALLGATSSDSKIYPQEARQGAKAPFIVYNLAGEGTPEEILEEFSVMTKIVTEGNTSYFDTQSIEGALDDLLNLQDGLKNKITSINYIFRWAKKATGADEVDPVTGQYYRIIVYDFKVHKLP